MPRKKLRVMYGGLLGRTCDLNIICIGDAAARKMNRRHRSRNTAANVLTFPAGTGPDAVLTPAEIYINADRALREAKGGNMPHSHRILFMALHGMLHLLGHTHGDAMESLEDKYATTYI